VLIALLEDLRPSLGGRRHPEVNDAESEDFFDSDVSSRQVVGIFKLDLAVPDLHLQQSLNVMPAEQVVGCEGLLVFPAKEGLLLLADVKSVSICSRL
jgi:hypothetical protein